MRELTKSIFSLSWAMSLLGLQQSTQLTSPDKAAQAFNSVAEATEHQLTEGFRSTFNVGEKLQRSAVDLTFGMVSGEGLNPNRLMRMATDMAKQSAEAVSGGLHGITSTLQRAAGAVTAQPGAAQPGAQADPAHTGPQQQPQGWGPMPS